MTKRKPAKMTENERLKTLLSISERSVQNLLNTPEWMQIADLTAHCRELEAENERLRSRTISLNVADAELGLKMNEVRKLQAENERLRKAGDRMAAALNGDYNHELDCVKDWSAAKQPQADQTK